MPRIARLTLVTLSLCVALPTAARAQRPAAPWLIELSGAYVIPSGDYNALVKSGWGASGFVGYEFNPQMVLAGNFNVSWMGAESCLGCTDFTNYSYFGMVGFNGAASVSNGDAFVLLGAGAMTFSPDGGDSTTRFALSGGIRSYFNISRSIAISLDAMAVVAFTPKDTFTGTTWLFPLGAGLAFRF